MPTLRLGTGSPVLALIENPEQDTMRYAHFTSETEARAYCAHCQAAGHRAYVLGMRADFWEVRVF